MAGRAVISSTLSTSVTLVWSSAGCTRRRCGGRIALHGTDEQLQCIGAWLGVGNGGGIQAQACEEYWQLVRVDGLRQSGQALLELWRTQCVSQILVALLSGWEQGGHFGGGFGVRHEALKHLGG